MAIISWITHPSHHFDSFYYYDTDNLSFVRIQLELGRTDQNPEPGIFAKAKRYVGFISSFDNYDFDNKSRWRVQGNRIVYRNNDGTEETISNQPAPDHHTIDFTLLKNAKHPGFIHKDNKVAKSHTLPNNSQGLQVTEYMLRTIALRLIGRDDTLIFCSSAATSCQLGDAIFAKYNERVLSAIPQDLRSPAIQIAEARAYFNNEDLPCIIPPLVNDGNPYADKEGLIQFIAGTELIEDPVVMANLTSQKSDMLSLLAIATGYINRYAAAYGDQVKMDIDLWELTISKLPLMSFGTVIPQRFSGQVQNSQIAAFLVQIILEIIARQGTPALNKFSDFLRKQEEAINLGIAQNKDSYSTIITGACVDTFKDGNQIRYFPTIKLYKVEFDRENRNWSILPLSYDSVYVNFNYLYADNSFDYEALKDPNTKNLFDQFIREQLKAQIQDASSFFNDDFPSQKS